MVTLWIVLFCAFVVLVANELVRFLCGFGVPELIELMAVSNGVSNENEAPSGDIRFNGFDSKGFSRDLLFGE